MATQKKIDTVNELTDKVKQAKALVFANYQGLKHKQLEELRKNLKKVQAEFVITKNTLIKRALGNDGKSVPDADLSGASATLFAFNDEASPVKELVNFFKSANLGTVRSGILGATPMNEVQVNKLASLPPKDVLLGKLVGQLQAPLYGLHNALSWNLRTLVWTLDAVKAKK